jgi:hypothetical protein
MNFTLERDIVLLCEGYADQAFFRTLLKQRNTIPKFDVPFPEARKDLFNETEPLHGKGSFGKMLKALRGDARSYSRLKGILIVADSGKCPDATFKEVCGKIKEAGGFDDPSEPMKPTAPVAGHPAVAVALIPDEIRCGSLETLCMEAIAIDRAWIMGCVTTYLSCGDIMALGWSPETRDKALLQCMIAAVNEGDPNKGLTYAFSGSPPIISVEQTCFDGVEERLKRFAVAVR